MWKNFSGLTVVTRNLSGGKVVLLSNSEGQVVRWTLEDRKSAADSVAAVTQRQREMRSRPGRGASSATRAPECLLAPPDFVIARCATLPTATLTGYGQLKSIATCGHDNRYAVGALQQAVSVRKYHPSRYNVRSICF